MKRAFVFIDGGNFYFKLKELVLKLNNNYSLLDFNFKKFSEWLAGSNKLAEIHYYLGVVSRRSNDNKSEELYANQQRLFRKLQEQNIIITLGQLIRHPDKIYHEKGVDVRLAVEMIRFAIGDRYDIAYLVSSDTDLVAAVEEVRSIGKIVQYVGMSKGQSFGLSKVANDVRLLRPEDIEQFLLSYKIKRLKEKVDDLYRAKKEGRADWADWLHKNHIFLVADTAGKLADKYDANKDMVIAAAMLHDIADTVMKRENPKHEEENRKIAIKLLKECGFSDAEIKIIVDDAMRFHSCHGNERPQTLEGKVMAAADAVVYLQSDFYLHASETKSKEWALSKIERDFNDKIAFEEVRETAKADYERLRAKFMI